MFVVRSGRSDAFPWWNAPHLFYVTRPQARGSSYGNPKRRFQAFHSLRGYFASTLQRTKHSPRVTQAFMRHSTITLTMDISSELGYRDTEEAMKSLLCLAARG